MSDSTWPPAKGLTTVHVPREQCVLQMHASARINAPASLVFNTILESSEYPKWNSFVPKVEILSQPSGGTDSGRLQVGTIIMADAIMDSKKPNKSTPTELEVTDISTPDAPSTYISADALAGEPTYTADLSKVYRIAWRSHGPLASRGLDAERFQEVIVTGENECEFRTWEVMGGLVVRVVKWLYQKNLEAKFQVWVADVKKYTEEKASSQGTA